MKQIFCLLIFSTLLMSCSGSGLKKTALILVRADGSEVSVQAELAVSAEQQRQGFMHRKNIPDGTGMLFVFERDQIASFWMKDTPTALSIAYIDSSGRIRDILDMKPYSLEPVQSTVSVRYALEVPQGWFLKMDIKTGDCLKLPVAGL